MEVVSLTYRKPLSENGDRVQLRILRCLSDGGWRTAPTIWRHAHGSDGVTAITSYLALQRLCDARRVEREESFGEAVYRLKLGDSL